MWIKTDSDNLINSDNVFGLGIRSFKCYSSLTYVVVAYSEGMVEGKGAYPNEHSYTPIKKFEDNDNEKAKEMAQNYLDKLAVKLGAEVI